MTKRLAGSFSVLKAWITRKTSFADENYQELFLRRVKRIRILKGLALLISAFLLLLVAWSAVKYYVEPNTPEERTNLLQTAAQIAAGIILLTGVYFTWRNL